VGGQAQTAAAFHGPPAEAFIIDDVSSGPCADDYLTPQKAGLKPTLKKIQPQANPPEADPNLPKCSIPRQKMNVDNKAHFRYQVGYWFRLINGSIYGATADADIQLFVFDSSASEKQLLSAPSKFGASDGVKVSIG
jgi:hypothetical protein